MKANKIWKTYVIVIVLSLIATICACIVFVNSAKDDNNTLDNLITFVVTILSMLVALLAYHISVKTYISIDAVNAISRMDGNVMEIENYRTNVISLIRLFDAETQAETCDQILHYIERLLYGNKINSGAKLADCIQGVIDVIVLFSFLIQRVDRAMAKKDDTIARIEAIIATIDKKVTEFEQMSEGSCILIRESVKLLKAVYTYQCYKSGVKSGSNITMLLDVRGAMLKNAISRTIYHNYIGLVYMNKAMNVINKYFTTCGKLGMDVLSIDAAKFLNKMPKSEDKTLAIVYLKEAIANYDLGVKTIRDELMWNAFILYNKARAQYIFSQLVDSSDTTWQQTMETAIEYRSKLVMLLNDILGEASKSYLHRAFSDQLKVAQLANIRLKLAAKIAVNPTECNVEIGIDEFHRLRNIKEDIKSHINPQRRICSYNS